MDSPEFLLFQLGKKNSDEDRGPIISHLIWNLLFENTQPTTKEPHATCLTVNTNTTHFCGILTQLLDPIE